VELPDEVGEALLGRDGRLRALYDLACAYLQGDWKPVQSNGFEIPEPQITSCYMEAMRSVDALTALTAN
jgi:c-di-GMP-related signal transduction protein